MRTNPIRFCSKLSIDDRSADRRRLNLTVTCAGNQCEQGLSIDSVRVAKTHRNALRLAVTPWLQRGPRDAGPKSYGLFCKGGLLFAYLCRSDTSSAPSRCVGAPQPYAHQWVLLEPRISHSPVPSNALLEFVQRRKLRLPRRRWVLDAVFVHLESLALKLVLVGLVARPSARERL